MRNRRGFTLAELLIAVAIIAVLVAIAIPVFTGQMEKSREAADVANIREAYAEIIIEAIDDESTEKTSTVSLKQTRGGWQTESISQTLISLGDVSGDPTPEGACEVSWQKDAHKVLFDFSGGRITFDTSSQASVAASYAKLVNKYIQNEQLNNRTVKSWLSEFNGHQIVNISNGDGKFINTIVDQAKADQYPDDAVAMIGRNVKEQPNQYSAYFDENLNLIGYYYNEQASWLVKPHHYLKDASGNTIWDGQSSLGDKEYKQKLADYLWPVT